LRLRVDKAAVVMFVFSFADKMSYLVGVDLFVRLRVLLYHSWHEYD